MKKSILSAFLIFMFFSGASQAMGNSQNQNQDNSQTHNASLDQAKQDYALFLQKMKELGAQYSQVTGEMKKVVKEQGVPVWDDTTGTIKVSHDVNFTDNGPIHETDNEIRVVLEKPGLKKDSIHVTIENDKTLHVLALKKASEVGRPDEPMDETYELPTLVPDPKPHAKYEDGVLTITIQKPLLSKKTVSVPIQ